MISFPIPHSQGLNAIQILVLLKNANTEGEKPWRSILSQVSINQQAVALSFCERFTFQPLVDTSLVPRPLSAFSSQLWSGLLGKYLPRSQATPPSLHHLHDKAFQAFPCFYAV